MRARLLGTGGWMPTEDRETSCLLLVKDGTALCVDAGTGFRRLVTDAGLLDGVERLHVALTHWHLDHTYGLALLPGLDLPVELWAPPPAQHLVHRLLDPPFLLGAEDDLAGNIEAVHDLTPAGAQIGPFDVAARVQPCHPSTSLALRIDGELAVCTDTTYDEGNVEFVRGARLLLHEAFHATDETDDPRHTAAGEAARLAAAAGVGRLVLIHANPRTDDDGAKLEHARRYFAATEIGRDGLELI
jgi:ribonuclease BN (tRNA processing enzyme)